MKKNIIDHNVKMTVNSLSTVVAALGLSLGTTIESVHAADVSNVQDKGEVYQQNRVKPKTTIQSTGKTGWKLERGIEASDKTSEKYEIRSTVKDMIKID